jgi:hypothetical protein
MGDVIETFFALNENYRNPLILENFAFEFYINDDGSYGEIHSTYTGSTVFEEWISSAEVKSSMFNYEQPRLDFLKDKIEITRYLDWDDTGISTSWRPYSEFVPTTGLTGKF